jgi:diaminopimelate epimerase
MSEPLRFAKMHGLGNDFVMVDARDPLPTPLVADLPDLARRICDRHYGVGGDGLILLLPSARADVRMRIFNRDGSEAEMCGNGIRCLAAFARDRGAVLGTTMTVETGAGVLTPTVLADHLVEVDMGEPILPAAQIPVALPGLAPVERVIDAPLPLDGETFTVTCVSMGNPHCVLFLDAQRGTTLDGVDLAAVPLASIGARLEAHPAFPAHANVEFAGLTGRDEIDVRVWERGAGATLACGTGACATMVAAALTGRVGPRARVHLPGGPLEIEWREGGTVKMRGPYAWVYDGEWRAA